VHICGTRCIQLLCEVSGGFVEYVLVIVGTDKMYDKTKCEVIAVSTCCHISNVRCTPSDVQFSSMASDSVMFILLHNYVMTVAIGMLLMFAGN